MPCCGKEKRRVLIVGGQFSGIFSARELKKKFHVTVVDCKEFFEYTPGCLRAFVKPAHLDALTFNLQPVLERTIGVKFIWGEVTGLKVEDGAQGQVEKKAIIKPIFQTAEHVVGFDYMLCCSGCNFGVMSPKGESLWFPTVHQVGREVSQWGHIDERFMEGRRRHILEEYQSLAKLNAHSSTILTAGAGFIGVEWVTELEHFFPKLKVTICDFLPICLGPLPRTAAEYCDEYMERVGINRFYSIKYADNDAEFWETVGLPMPKKADRTFECLGVKASNYYMPKEVLSDVGPGGGGWIMMNEHLQVVEKTDTQKLWPKDGSIFAIGDCNFGCIGKMEDVADPADPSKTIKQFVGPLNPIPKISYPGEEQAFHACKNVVILDRKLKGGGCCRTKKLWKTWWPWGAGMFATSLGPHDACFVVAANHNKYSGYMVNWWIPAALQKEVIETTKVNECKDGLIGVCIWHFVHHTPFNLWGAGPCIPICCTTKPPRAPKAPKSK